MAYDKKINPKIKELTSEELESPELEEKPGKFKKFFTIAIALFLIFLISSYVLASFGLGDIILSLIKSEKITENKIRINGTSFLIFNGDSYEQLLEKYLSNQDKEFKSCLIGKIKNNNYEVEKIITPKTISQSFNRVVSKTCPDGTIADLHSQPYRRCIESDQDFKTKGIIKQTDPERLMVIMCEKERFNFY